MMRSRLRTAMKSAAARTLRYSGTAAIHRRVRRGAIVLTYHGILPSGRPQNEYLSRNCVDQDVFAQQIAHLARHYTCLSLRELVDLIRDGRQIPPRSAVVTFDDGFLNNYSYAYPVLRDMRVPATIFVTAGHVGHGCLMLWTERIGWLLSWAPASLRELPVGDHRLPLDLSSSDARERTTRAVLQQLKRTTVADRTAAAEWLQERLRGDDPEPDRDRYAFMEWEHARQMADSGLIEIGSHTVSHLLLSTGSENERRDEIGRSRSIIEQEVGRPCTLFAYPNGTTRDFAEIDIQILRECGYEGAVTQVPGTNASDTHLYALRRVNIARGHGIQIFVALTAGVWRTTERSA